MPGAFHPDALSGLVQLSSKRLGVDLKWTGKGLDDLHQLALLASNTNILSKTMWEGLQELWAMPELKQLPEPIYAKICAIILKTRAVSELNMEKRNARAMTYQPGQVPPPVNDGARPL
jgi:hypothetical protein